MTQFKSVGSPLFIAYLGVDPTMKLASPSMFRCKARGLSVEPRMIVAKTSFRLLQRHDHRVAKWLFLTIVPILPALY